MAEPARAWLTVEAEGVIVSCAVITKTLSAEQILKPGPLPAMPDVREFSPEFLVASPSPDGVVVVEEVLPPFARPLRRTLNALLREGGFPTLSPVGFRGALNRGQLTCHAGATEVHGGEPRPTDKYAGVATLQCVNNLLFSVAPPSDRSNVAASLGVIGVSEGEDAGWIPGSHDGEGLLCVGEERPGPWAVPWAALLPILQGVTDREASRPICIANLPSGVSEDGELANAATKALIQFERSLGGLDAFFEQVRWEDPCLPQALVPFLAAERITLTQTDRSDGRCGE